MALLFLRCFYYLSGCDEFTVDSCRPDPSQIINAGYLPNRYDQNDKEGTCQNFCDRQTDCTYWSVYCPRTPGSEHCNCTLYGHSYLRSCQTVGGDQDTDIEVILKVEVIFKLNLGCMAKKYIAALYFSEIWM